MAKDTLGEHLIEGMKNALAYAQGEVVEGARSTTIPRIAVEAQPKKLDNLKRREDYLLCDPEEIVHMDWSQEENA